MTVLGALLVVTVGFAANALVLAYPASRWVRSTADRVQSWFTGRPDWGWIQLWQIMALLALLIAATLVVQVPHTQCPDDALALLASGQATLHGQNPFSVTFCGGTSPVPIPYGTAAVALDALGALSGGAVGIWVAWEVLALAVVPLVWSVAGGARRYKSVLALVSIVYLPNVITNMGENVIVAVSVLLMLFALQYRGRLALGFKALAVFLSTARFPALFPLLGSSSQQGRRRGSQLVLVLAVFFGTLLVALYLWGWDAIQVVYLSQFTRANDVSVNIFALVIHQGWVYPSYAFAALQGALLLGLVLLVNVRKYSTLAGCAIPIIGVTLLSQYVSSYFSAWLIPLILMGAVVNWWLLIYGTLALIDQGALYGSLLRVHGIWWPYELCGVVLTAILLCMLITIVREEEARIRTERSPTTGPPPARAGSPDG